MITVTSSTVYHVGSAPGTKADVKVGSKIGAQGTVIGDTFTATAIEVEPPSVAGEVTAKTGSTITVQPGRRLDRNHPRLGDDRVQGQGSGYSVACRHRRRRSGDRRGHAPGRWIARRGHGPGEGPQAPKQKKSEGAAARAPRQAERKSGDTIAWLGMTQSPIPRPRHTLMAELVGAHLRLTGMIHLGRFTRLTDFINASRGFIQIHDVRLLLPDGTSTDVALPELMIDQDEVSFIGQQARPSLTRVSRSASSSPKFEVAEAVRKPREFVMFTPGHSVSGKVHCSARRTSRASSMRGPPLHPGDRGDHAVASTSRDHPRPTSSY